MRVHAYLVPHMKCSGATETTATQPRAGRYAASLGALFGALLGACEAPQSTTPVALVTLPETSGSSPGPLSKEDPLMGCAEALAALEAPKPRDRPELPDDLAKKRHELRKIRVGSALQADVQAYDDAISAMPILSGSDSFAQRTVDLISGCQDPECEQLLFLVGGHTMHQDLSKTLPLLADELDKLTFNNAELASRVRAYSIATRDHVRRMEALGTNMQKARSAETRLGQTCRAAGK